MSEIISKIVQCLPFLFIYFHILLLSRTVEGNAHFIVQGYTKSNDVHVVKAFVWNIFVNQSYVYITSII